MAVLDNNLKPIQPLSECFVYIGEGTIYMTMPDHAMRKYDMEGTIINGFYISSIRMLEYEKKEIVYRKNMTVDGGDGVVEELEECYHPKSTARLRVYVVSDIY